MKFRVAKPDEQKQIVAEIKVDTLGHLNLYLDGIMRLYITTGGQIYYHNLGEDIFKNVGPMVLGDGK